MKEKNKFDHFSSFANNLYGPVKENLCDFLDNNDNSINHIFIDAISKYKYCSPYIDDMYIVLKHNNVKQLFIVDKCFCIKHVVDLKIPNCYHKEEFLSICYDNSSCKIYIAQKSKIFSITIDGDFINDEINDISLKKIITENSSINEISQNCCKPNVKILKPCICSIGFSENSVLVIYEKNKSVFIAKLTKAGNLVNEQYIDDDICSTYIIDNHCSLFVIAQKNSCFNYIYTFNKSKPLCKKHKNHCEIILNSECRVDIECPDLPCSLEGSLCEVVRSIALIENGIAKLISCESEKIKSAIENTVCNKDLIDINNSVSKTIMNITMLEQMLKEKLEIAINLHDTCK